MGLPMDNLSEIHVPSGPSSVGQHHDLSKFTLNQLISRKDDVEAEMKALGQVLDSHGVNMRTSLTTFDGYPRDDIDVAQVATTRSRIIVLRNDWKDLMDKIEKGLHKWHEESQAAEISKETLRPSPRTPSVLASATNEVPQTPFATVNDVTQGSPAHEAGLKKEDRIRAFGHIDWTNHERLRKVGEVVQRNVGRPILVKVVRGNGPNAQELQLRLTPRTWSGRGLLGCHIV